MPRPARRARSRIRSKGFPAPLGLFALCTVLAASAQADDGALEINQACVATGCFPGDAAGFPVNTQADEKYVLTSDLVLASADSDGVIVAEGSTLDLNGFAITGPITCSGTPIVCAGDGNGFAIMAFSRSTVRNGAVRGMRSGVNLQGRGHLVENVAIEHNGAGGVNGVGEGAIVRGCRVARNEGGGISLSNGHGALVTGNTVTSNTSAGIGLSGAGGLVERNTIVGNTGVGIAVSATTGFGGNVITGNNNGGSQTSGGVQIGSNVCGNDTVCP
jgi:parallel beta-helix repeat protein